MYVYVRNSTSAWSQQAYTKASNSDNDDHFSRSIALSDDGNFLAVGAIYDDSAAIDMNDDESDNNAKDSVAAYLFRRNGTGAWSQYKYIKAANTGAGELFGRSVSISADANTLAIGARNENSAATGINGNPVNDCLTEQPTNNYARSSGAVYLYQPKYRHFFFPH